MVEFHCWMAETGLLRWLSGKEPICQCRRSRSYEFDPWVGKIPRRRKWQPTLVFLPGESHGQSSLVGYSPWGHRELDMTEHTCMHDRNQHSTVKIKKKIEEKGRVACLDNTVWQKQMKILEHVVAKEWSIPVRMAVH